MFQIDKTLISEELISKNFVCNLSACKGACCVEGEAGAPLEEEEIKILENDFEAIKPYLSDEARKHSTKIRQISVASLLAESIRRIASGDSVSSLFME